MRALQSHPTLDPCRLVFRICTLVFLSASFGIIFYSFFGYPCLVLVTFHVLCVWLLLVVAHVVPEPPMFVSLEHMLRLQSGVPHRWLCVACSWVINWDDRVSELFFGVSEAIYVFCENYTVFFQKIIQFFRKSYSFFQKKNCFEEFLYIFSKHIPGRQ